ncbi:F-box protein [Cardamine amara subsp. amara]|uniref:F-box protein n=1 Tax=Cardamine amara subsp. amara TaxID=228776 RepID=A0ABD0ZB63_CARAN
MAIISDLSRDLVEEVLARVPLTSLRAVRFTCKNWNDLSKDGSFIKKKIVEAKKKQAKEFEVIMMMNYRVYLMSVNLSNVDPSIKPKAKLITLNDISNDYQVDISTVFHCDGLLLCVTKDINSRLVVWNPYFGQTRWIKPRNSYHHMDKYALGYEKKMNSSNVSHKVLRFVDNYYAYSPESQIYGFELYSLTSNSWKVLDITSSDWGREIKFIRQGLSLKGNTWYVIDDLLMCFDFTMERFGPRLRLPFPPSRLQWDDTITLSSVGEEQLAVLYQCAYTLRTEIWVTSKIEPNEVSWNTLFLLLDMRHPTGFQFQTGNFFIDLKQNVAVVFDKDKDVSNTRSIAYIIGKKGYFKKVDLGESTHPDCYPLVCSYVPSSVQI